MLKLTSQEEQEILCCLESSKARKLDVTSVARKCAPERRKITVKVLDIFGNYTITVIGVTV